MTLRDQQRMGPYSARHYTGTNQLHLTSTSKYLPTAVLHSLSPLSDGGDQQIALHKDRADRVSPLGRSLSGRAVAKSTRCFMSEGQTGDSAPGCSW